MKKILLIFLVLAMAGSIGFAGGKIGRKEVRAVEKPGGFQAAVLHEGRLYLLCGGDTSTEIIDLICRKEIYLQKIPIVYNYAGK